MAKIESKYKKSSTNSEKLTTPVAAVLSRVHSMQWPIVVSHRRKHGSVTICPASSWSTVRVSTTLMLVVLRHYARLPANSTKSTLRWDYMKKSNHICPHFDSEKLLLELYKIFLMYNILLGLIREYQGLRAWCAENGRVLRARVETAPLPDCQWCGHICAE